MMIRTAVFAAILALTTSQGFPPVQSPITCASTLCFQGSTCKEVLNVTSGTTQARCLESVSETGNEGVCRDGQPLFVDLGNGQGVGEATCGRSPDRITCPSGYACNIAPNDAYAVCCPSVAGALTEKPGDCPKRTQGGQVGICANTCSSDSQCEGSDKCCQNACGATTCQAPDVGKPSCQNMQCGKGERCVMQEVLCIQAPCYPEPTCVSDQTLVSVKEGSCPVPQPGTVGICANTCNADGDCKGTQRCCRNACGATTCQAPVIEVTASPSCLTTRCGRGEKCVMKDVQCFFPPCDQQPTCVADEAQAKAGRCPAVAPRRRGFRFGICVATCRVDQDCQGADKCCLNSCGVKTCQGPAGLIAPKPSCETMRCGSRQKCVMKTMPCFRAPCEAIPVCEAVSQNKEGVCPRVRRQAMFNFNCFTRCGTDGDCPSIQKCCRGFFCGATCQDPDPSITCANMNCKVGYYCVMQNQLCHNPPCNPVATCIRAEQEKRCPMFPAWINPNCLRRDLCSDSVFSKCRPGYICCSTDCGKRCLRPV